MSFVILVVLGLIAGTVGSLIGLGGGIVIVPSLMFLSTVTRLFQDVTPQVAIGTSLLVIIFTGLSSTLAYIKYKTVDYKSGLIFFIGSGPGKDDRGLRVKAVQFKLVFRLVWHFYDSDFIILNAESESPANQQSAQRNYPDISG